MVRYFLALVGVTLSAVAMFFWGFVFWSLSGVMERDIRPVPTEYEKAFAQVIRDQFDEDAIYMLPMPPADMMENPEANQAFGERLRSGPYLFMLARPKGIAAYEHDYYLPMGFAHMWISSLLAALLLFWLPPGTGFGRRWMAIVLMGLVSAVWTQLGDPIWFHYPWSYAIRVAGYDLISWWLAAFPLALFCYPKSPPAAPQKA